MKPKLLAYLALTAELAITAALFESVVFEGEYYWLFKIALSFITVLAFVCLLTKSAPSPTIQTSLSLTAAIAFKISIVISNYWHDSLTSDVECILGPSELFVILSFIIAQLLDISLSKLKGWIRKIKLVIYSFGLSFFIFQLITLKTTAKYFCADASLAATDFSFLAFLLPVLFLTLCFLPKKLASTNCAQKTLHFSGIILLIWILPTFVGLIEASVKMASKPMAGVETKPLPNIVKIPLLVAEDPIFFNHYGLDFSRLQEAAKDTILNGSFGRGGSTISMQLFKILYQNFEKTLWRKFVQILGAKLIEMRFSKQKILELYAQNVPFAADVIGIENASKTYFNRSPNELTQEQALQLVVTIFEPGKYNPSLASMPKDVGLRLAVVKTRTQLIGRHLGP